MSEHGSGLPGYLSSNDPLFRVADSVERHVKEILSQITISVMDLPDPEQYSGISGRARIEWERNGAYIAVEIYADETAKIEAIGMGPYRLATIDLAAGQGIPTDCLKWFEEFANYPS